VGDEPRANAARLITDLTTADGGCLWNHRLVAGDQGATHMVTQHTPLNGLASIGFSVMRCGLATTFVWVGALKFKEYEVENAEVLVTASPLTSRLREKLGPQKLGRLIGVTQIALGALIAAKPFAPRASAVGSFGAAGMMLGTLSFLVTTPEAWQEGQGVPQLSVLGEALLKDSVLLGASLLTAAESLRAARTRGPNAHSDVSRGRSWIRS
jgi:reactive chlorine resistance protein C